VSGCRACPAFAKQKRGYNFDRSRVPIAIGIIPGYKVIGRHWSGRGIGYYKYVLGAGAKVEEPRFAG